MNCRWIAAAFVLGAFGCPAANGTRYGCWSIADQIERLACFDLALGSPVVVGARPEAEERPESGSARSKAPVAPQRRTDPD